jgi:hypothetical protein
MIRPTINLDSGERLRVGTWNLERGEPQWRRPLQAIHVSERAVLWLLTEIPANTKFDKARSSFSGLVPLGNEQCWAAVNSTLPMKPVKAKHPSLAMARITLGERDFLAAASVFPWRSAAKYWPASDGDTFAERCARTLEAHAAEIERASTGLPVVWGGDFNQALSGPEHVGSDAGREALLDAFQKLHLRAVTIEAAGQDPNQRSIDHIAIPSSWSLWAVDVQRPHPDGRPLSDHPSYVVSVERPSLPSNAS